MTGSVPSMRFSLLVPLAIAATAFPAWAGTPKEAAAIREAYDRDFQIWVLKLQVAPNAEERTKLTTLRPDTASASRKMWNTIQPNLAEDWTLDYAAWLLRITAGRTVPDEQGNPVPLIGNASKVIRDSVEKHHLASKNLAPLCMAAVAVNDPNSLPLLQKIESQAPDRKIQGVAALGIAMLMKNLGDESEVMRQRLTLLKKAIIESSEIEINGVSVAKLAEDELYIIRFLSKGRQAPDLVGTGSGGQPMKLSDYQGKVVILLFWRAEEGSTEQLVELGRGLRERFAGKPFEVVGVNRDPVASLRGLQADGQIAWPNFSDPENRLGAQYRVGTWPLAYVLDGQRTIHYVGPVGSFVELTAAALLDPVKK
jgi:peroxiredoxin